MSLRELLVLGTASQVPTRHRNHNGYLLRWDDQGLLFNPGEGTQRQLTLAGVAVSSITHIFITHFHGDHCLGLSSIVQRLSLDRAPHPIEVFFPASDQRFFERLVSASHYHRAAHIVARPVATEGADVRAGSLEVAARPLEHAVDTLGYRLSEPDGVRFRPEDLERLGIRGPSVGELERIGSLRVDEETARIEDVSDVQPGAVFAFIMDTRPTESCHELARDADLLVCEATYLEEHAELAHRNLHMTAVQAAQLAREASVRSLILTHFSQRYHDVEPFLSEARPLFPAVDVARDLERYPFPRPPRRVREAGG